MWKAYAQHTQDIVDIATCLVCSAEHVRHPNLAPRVITFSPLPYYDVAGEYTWRRALLCWWRVHVASSAIMLFASTRGGERYYVVGEYTWRRPLLCWWRVHVAASAIMLVASTRGGEYYYSAEKHEKAPARKPDAS